MKKSIIIGEERLQNVTGLNSEYNQNKGAFTVKKQVGWVGDISEWEITKKRLEVWGDSGGSNPREILLNAVQNN